MGTENTENIFVSYRREDSAAYAGRISDHLTELLGEERVFMDVEDIAPGQNFAQKIDETLANCKAVLVVMGPRWNEILQSRLKNQQEDYVRHEIEAALERKTNVIPVLVGGAKMIGLTSLPPGLAELPMHQAVELRDDTFKEDCGRLAAALGAGPKIKPIAGRDKGTWRKPAVWLACCAGIIALGAVGYGPWSAHRERQSRILQITSTAQTQVKLAEYESAFKSYGDALKLDSDNKAALNGQVAAAMLWIENFHVLVGEGQKAEDLAGPALAELMSTLEAALARTGPQGSRAADILAHLGWAHWLNQHIASKEFGPAAENTLRQALTVEPTNVYANAMLGNWLLQNGGSLAEAVHCFDTALRTGQQKPLIREMQLGGMLFNDAHGVRAETMRVANQMRINGESMEAREKHDLLESFYPYRPADLQEALTAVSPNDAWATYVWLDDKHRQGYDARSQKLVRELIHASILEVSGSRAAALAEFTALERDVKAGKGAELLGEGAAEGIRRLASSQ